MKTSLKTKLLLAFVLVALITGAVLVFVFNRFNQRQFNQFVIDKQREELISVLTNHYQEHQNWDGAQIYFQAYLAVKARGGKVSGKVQGQATKAGGDAGKDKSIAIILWTVNRKPVL